MTSKRLHTSNPIVLKLARLSFVSCLTVALSVFLCAAPTRQTKPITLAFESSDGLKPVNAKVEPVTYKGRKALRVTDVAPAGTSDDARFVVVTGSQFEDGLIEVDVAGDRIPGAPEAARGFVGIAFRVAQAGPPLRLSICAPITDVPATSCSATTRLSTSPVQTILGIDCARNLQGNTRLMLI